MSAEMLEISDEALPSASIAPGLEWPDYAAVFWPAGVASRMERGPQRVLCRRPKTLDAKLARSEVPRALDATLARSEECHARHLGSRSGEAMHTELIDTVADAETTISPKAGPRAATAVKLEEGV